MGPFRPGWSQNRITRWNGVLRTGPGGTPQARHAADGVDGADAPTGIQTTVR